MWALASGNVHFFQDGINEESGEEKWVDTNSELVRYDYEKEFFRVTDYTNYMFRKSGCSLLHLRTDEDYVKVLQKFFISRNR